MMRLVEEGKNFCFIRTMLLVIVLIVPATFSDKNRLNSIGKRHYIEDGSSSSSSAAAAAASSASLSKTSSSSTSSSSTSSHHSTNYSQPFLNGCGSCKMREEIKNRNLEVIKGEMLRRMGFKTAPNLTGLRLPPVPPHFLAKIEMDYGGMQSDQPAYKTGFFISEEEDNYHIRTQEILTFAQPYPRLRHWRGHDILHFTFSENIVKYRVSNATLYIYIKGAEKHPLPDVLIEIFKVYKTDHSDSPKMYRVVTKKITQPYGIGNWVKVDLSVTVSEWFKNPKENYGFVVNATANGKKVIITDTTIDNGSKAPFVEISTMEAKRRTRRNAGLNCDDDTNESLCCRYPLMVDFEEFGWDFIIAPKRYNAYYCSGDCPFITLQKHPHTHLVTMSQPNSAQPCCAPRKMRPISMLYFDLNLSFVYGSIPGMVVDRCGCT